MGIFAYGSIFAVLISAIGYYFLSMSKGKATSVIVQAFHFLSRQSVSIPKNHHFEPIRHPSAWTGSYLSKHPDQWMDILTEQDKTAFTAAIKHFQTLNKSMEAMIPADFPLPEDLKRKVASWKHQLGSKGFGFQAIRGTPVHLWSFHQSEIFFFALGKYLGIPGAQDNVGTLLGHVKSVGYTDNKERPYRQTVDIGYHCDGSDVVGLLCLHPAKEGGISRIISSVAVFNKLLSLPRGQEYAHKLLGEIFLSIRATFGLGLKVLPITAMKMDKHGILRSYWNQEYYVRAYRHANGTVTEAGLKDPLAMEAVEAYDHILDTDMRRGYVHRGNCSNLDENPLNDCITYPPEEEELGLDMVLQAGDIQLVSNHFVLHARTEFVDYTEEEIEAAPKMIDGEGNSVPRIGKRELFRLWLSHSNEELEWDEYISKYLDLVNVIGGIVRAMIFYR